MEKSYVASLSGHQEKRVQINAFLKTFFALRVIFFLLHFLNRNFFGLHAYVPSHLLCMYNANLLILDFLYIYFCNFSA